MYRTEDYTKFNVSVNVSTPGPWDAWNTGVCFAWGRLGSDNDHDDHDEHDEHDEHDDHGDHGDHGDDGYDDHDDQDGDADADQVVNYEPLSLNTDLWSIGVITYIMLSGIINIIIIIIIIINIIIIIINIVMIVT